MLFFLGLGVRVGLKFALHGHYAPRHGPTPPHGPEYITYKGLTLRKAPENQTYSGKFLGFCMWFFWMYMFYNKFSERVYPGHSAHLDHDLAHEPSIYDPEDVDEDYYKEYARKWGIGAAAEGGAAAAAHGHH